MQDFFTLAVFIFAGLGIIAAGLVAYLLHRSDVDFQDQLDIDARLQAADTQIAKRPRVRAAK